MIGLSHVLPPLASDYSGAASLLYEHGVVCVMMDAGCCTNNYLNCDEPRWRTSQKDVYSISLRTLDVTLGDEELLVRRIARTVHESCPSAAAIALVGTPVPAITGMDMDGLACEVEALTGIPTIGVATGGFKTYDAGLTAAFKALLSRFGEQGRDAGRSGGGETGGDGKAGGEGTRLSRPNRCDDTFVLGASMLDYGTSGALADALRRATGSGAILYPDPLADPQDDTELGVLERLTHERRVVVASSAGVEMAKLLEKRYGTAWSADIELDAGSILVGTDLSPSTCSDPSEGAAERVLIVHDQVIANALRRSLEQCREVVANAGTYDIRVASLSGWHTELARSRDTKTPDESSLETLLHAWQPTVVVGDPLLTGLVHAAGCKGCKLIPLPWPALSGRLGW